MSRDREVSVAVTRFREPDWLLDGTLQALAALDIIDAEVLVLDQCESAATADLCARLSRKSIQFLYQVIPARSLSYARNQAIKRASRDRILFLDADAVPAPAWASELAQTLARAGVGVAGGRVVPNWRGLRPLLARARIVAEQYSILDLGESEHPVSKVIGASLGIDRLRLGEQAYFNERLGRRDGILLGGEDTDLCARALGAGCTVYYNGRSRVDHQILGERLSYRWIMKRFYYAGMGRALCGGAPAPSHSLRVLDYLVLPAVLPAYLAGQRAGRRRAAEKHGADRPGR